jgi:aminopeptidase N
MNAGSGQSLNWFWKSWFFDNGTPDLAITHVTSQKGLYTIVITNEGSKPVPINLTLNYNDGSTQLVHQSIAAWKNGNKTFAITQATRKKIKRMVLGTTYDPDVNKENNVWESK